MTRTTPGMLAALAATLAAGCARTPDPQYAPSAAVEKLAPELQAKIKAVLAERCGSPSAPRLLGAEKADPARLKHGRQVYARYCQQCHGVSGGGDGVAAKYLMPRPRDYRPGVFKFTSTTYGAKPLREDLVRTVRRGILGTSMPAFDLLPPNDLEAVVDYVLSLTRRGELEGALADEAEFNGGIEDEVIPELVAGVLKRWDEARYKIVSPLTPMPEFTAAHAQRGRAAFQVKGCIQCHGPDGRGQTKENIGVDGWGRPTKAADLTSGMLRGGTEPLDIYRHIDAGINGTPMPSFHEGLKGEPETIWDLVAFVINLSNERRRGVIPEAGLLKPLPGVEPRSTAAATPDVALAR